MRPTKKPAKMISSLILVFILFGITLTYATGEGDYKNDTNPLTRIFEGTFAENGYKTNIFVNPTVTGAYDSESNYRLDLTVNPTGVGDARGESGFNLDLTPQKGFPEEHDLKVSGITTSRTRVGKGYDVIIDVTVSNLQLNYETFFLTINASDTIISTQQKTLTSRESAIVSFVWNTAGVNYGDYTVSARVVPVPGEAFTWDNTLIGSVVMVTIPGDSNGDKSINSLDIGALNVHWSPATGTPPWSLGYSLDFDTNDDGYINSLDIGKVNLNWGQSWAPP